MPELPEVETIKRYLNKAISGNRIVNIEILSKKQFPDNPKEVIGEKILSVERRAKNLIIKLSNKKTLIIHLKLSGQLIWERKTKIPVKSTRVIISLNSGKLFFNEMRKFGWIKILNQNQLDLELARFGPEPLSKDFSIEYLQKAFGNTSRPIKIVLLDQEKIAGIGNIYANEALFEAKINPQKLARRLTAGEIKRLRKAILLVLKEGIKYNGASAADQLYVKPDSSFGSYQQYFRIYQKNGEKCQKCKTIIERISLGGRGTFFCPKCQM
ncbi:bifunctional DNA-formamidopyrimidine glycosylase/DNA-(apurinic or apyrimidinic site) lyase [Candidatus Parcubacteria bacterium]|nr:bifunctional DNA-formamidopyrimidine glycosylase/DNA-(apurinic or apyrimidinic site) lyase [Candidatus Parcubacteria bacterium]